MEEPSGQPQPKSASTEGIARELPWLVALGIAVCGLTVFLLTMGKDGGDLANVLALPVAIIGVIVSVFVYRLEHRPPRPDPSAMLRHARAQRIGLFAHNHPNLAAAAAVVAVATVVSGGMVVIPRWVDAGAGHLVSPNPADSRSGVVIGGDINAKDREALRSYLSGTVVVGINGTLPGWSLSSSPEQATGFDPDLIKFLQKKYDFEVQYKNLRPKERDSALESETVKLVAASYSWLPERQQKVNFAGPYFHDRSGVLCSDQKTDCGQVIPQPHICVTKDTTAAKNLPQAQQKDAIGDCMDSFYDTKNTSVVAVATDQTILLAYGHRVGYVGTVVWSDEPDHPISEEFYGLGVPKARHDVCRALAAEISAFLSSPDGWAAAFRSNLVGQNPFGLKPDGVRLDWCT
jgi:glutamate transport system substrate-binding protein